MRKKDMMLIQLLEQMLKAWSELYSIEEIACDEAKVDTLLDALRALQSERTQVPDFVRDVYMRVFLRDVWDQPPKP